MNTGKICYYNYLICLSDCRSFFHFFPWNIDGFEKTNYFYLLSVHIWFISLIILFVYTENVHKLYCLCYEQGQSNADSNRESSEKETIEIKEVGALGFIVVASAFLVLLFFFMSTGVVMLLTVMFSIAGSQVYMGY